MSKENGLERAKSMLFGAQVNLRSDDDNEHNLGPGNALLYVAKFQRLVEKPVEKTDNGDSGQITFGGCTI